MKLVVVDGVEEGMEGHATQEALRQIFQEALALAIVKEQEYGGAWREQGWMGNLSRILSKASRLKNMLWMDFAMESNEETTEDTALDMINLSAFFLLNKASRNKWGRL